MSDNSNNIFPFNVLIVEDESILLETARLILVKFVNQVYLAKNGKTGLEVFQEKRPEVIITDIDMPEMDGLKMSKEVLEQSSETFIVILTSYDKPEFMLDAINSGIRGFLTKPLTPSKVYELLEKFNQDYQEKQKEKKVIHRINATFDSQESMLVTTDGKQIITANKSLLDFFGYINLESLVGDRKQFNNLFPGLLEEYIEYLYDNANKNTVLKNRISLVNPITGKNHIFLTKSNYIKDLKIYVFSFVDITELEERSINLELKASTDNLTKIYNRLKFSDLFEHEFYRMQREKTFSTLLMFDIDYFKKINDTFGHKAGDDVLVNMAILIQKTIRKTDIFARWGGEEFLILLPSTGIDGGMLLAEKIKSKIEEHDFGIVNKITISIGITEILPSDNLDTSLQRVDIALYDAKNSGRNCIKIR